MMATGELKQTNLNNANRQVQTILTREEYCGGSTELSNYQYPAIITRTQYEKCRKIAKDKTKEHSRVKQICLCKRLLYCKANNYTLTPNIAKNQYKLYTIDKKYNMTVKIDLMDKLIWDVVVDYVSKHDETPVVKAKLEEESKVLLKKIQQSTKTIEEIQKQIDRIESRIIEGKMSEIKGDNMIQEKNVELKEQYALRDKYNYSYARTLETMYRSTYDGDISKIEDMNERQMLVRKYVSKVWLEKTGEKRGHYYVEIIMNDNTIYRYKLWSSGPWNNITSLGTCD